MIAMAVSISPAPSSIGSSSHRYCTVRSLRLNSRFTAFKRRLDFRCMSSDPGADSSSSSIKSEEETSETTTKETPTLPPLPSKTGNRIVAGVSVLAALCLFFVNRNVGLVGPSLRELSAVAVSYEEALHNGKPTVLEFYADWCEVCREMAKDVYSVEEKYRDRVNFVMLNVDNAKWESELDEFGVEGIPHFAFLDRQGNEEGNIVGRLPGMYLAENVEALAKGLPTVPHSRAVGQFSNADLRQSPRIVQPRAHGN